MLQIYFDEYLLDGKWVRSLTQQASSFDSQFKLGSTICRAFELQVDKRFNELVYEKMTTESDETLQTENLEDLLASLEIPLAEYKPSKIYLKNDGVLYATLYVDDFSDDDDSYYSYSLTDVMVKFNQEFDYDIATSHSTKALVETICTNHGISLVTQSFYMDDLMINWNQDGMTERDFIGYVAEVNGGYAYINADGNLVIQTYSQTSQKTIDVKECSSFKLGTYHLIDRVYVELAEATHYYPDETENETVYLNSDNILLTDSGSYTIDGIVKHVQAAITGFNFYNIKVDRCPIDGDVLCGNLVTFTLDDDSYNTIAQIDLTYGGSWYGGYELELDSAEQQETQIDTAIKIAKNIKIKVDREIGEIEQKVSDVEGNVTQLVQDAEGITGTFANYKGVKYIKANTDGITISSSDEESPTELNLDNDGVFVKDAEGNEVAAMEANTFRTSEWLMTQTKDNTVFNIFRRWGDE